MLRYPINFVETHTTTTPMCVTMFMYQRSQLTIPQCALSRGSYPHPAPAPACPTRTSTDVGDMTRGLLIISCTAAV